jgi:phosphate transport system permease protein
MLSKKLFFIITRGIFLIITILFSTIFIYLIYKGLKNFNFNLVSNELWAPIQGTILLILLSVTFATPLGIATGIYINSYAKGKFKKILDLSFEILASTPSIIIGLFGFTVLLLLHNFFENFRASLFLASLSLAFLILPYIVKATQLGMAEAPKEYINIAYSLGATKEKVILKILLPFAKTHIIKGIFLAITRSAEDTAVIMLTGVVASYGSVNSIFSPFEALPFYIYYTSANYSDNSQLNTIYVAILFLMAISTIFMFLIGKSDKIISKGKLWLR